MTPINQRPFAGTPAGGSFVQVERAPTYALKPAIGSIADVPCSLRNQEGLLHMKREYGRSARFRLSTENVHDYSQLKQCQAISSGELRRVEKALGSEGFAVVSQVEIGSTTSIIERGMESSDSDLIVLIKRKTLKGHLEKREDTAYAIASKYPGKLIVIRRGD